MFCPQANYGSLFDSVAKSKGPCTPWQLKQPIKIQYRGWNSRQRPPWVIITTYVGWTLCVGSVLIEIVKTDLTLWPRRSEAVLLNGDESIKSGFEQSRKLTHMHTHSLPLRWLPMPVSPSTVRSGRPHHTGQQSQDLTHTPLDRLNKSGN